MTEVLRTLTLAHLALGASPMDTIDAGADAGFGAVGLRICARRPAEPFAWPVLGNASRLRELRQRAADRGVRLSNISGYQFYPDVTLADVEPVVAATVELGAPVIVANGFDHDEARFTERLGRYGELARTAGIRVALEFLPYSGVRTLAAALRVVTACGASNAGVLVDALHLDRSGGSPADLASVPPERIVFAQLCDALHWSGPKSDEALLAEARGARLPAGTGSLPLFAFLDALPRGCEIEYEVARRDLAQCSPAEKARAAAADAERFMAAYRARPAGAA